MNGNLDYGSMSDDELDVVISGMLDQGLNENQINQQLWGPTIDEPENVKNNIIWDNFVGSSDDMIQRLDAGGEIQMGDFIYDSSDMTTPTGKVERSVTLPSYRKRKKDLVYYPFNPGRNKWLSEGSDFGDAPLQLNEGEELTPETYEDILTRNGYEKHLEKGEGGEMYEQWRMYEDVPEQTITESEWDIYQSKNTSFDKDMSFDDYAKKWKVSIAETISPWDPKLTAREKELKLKVRNSLNEIGSITEDSPDFLEYLESAATSINLQDTFFDVIRTTAQFGGKGLDENSTVEEILAFDKTARDKELVNMFGEEKGAQMINYLNNNPEVYRDMIDANPFFGELTSNIIDQFSDSGEGITAFNKQVLPQTVERRNTDQFLIDMGILNPAGPQIQGGRVPNRVYNSLSSEYLEYLRSGSGEKNKYELLQKYKLAKVNKFLMDNDIGGMFSYKHITGYDDNDFNQISARDKDGSWIYGYGSEALRYTSPENEDIYQHNKKIQQDYYDHAARLGYTGFGRGVASTLTLRIGEPIKLGTGADERVYQLKPYVKPEIQREYVQKTSDLIYDVTQDEIKKYDYINEKAKPYFEAIKNASNDLKFFDIDPEVISPSAVGMPESTREFYRGAINRRNDAITALEESGLSKELQDQYTIMKGLEDVNDVFFDQAEALGNLSAMTDSAFKNQSDMVRMQAAFARTFVETQLALGLAGVELGNVFMKQNPFLTGLSEEAMQHVRETMFVTPMDMFNEEMSEEFLPKLEYDSYLPGQGADYLMQTLATSMPTLSMVFGPSFMARLGTRSFVKGSMSKIADDMLKAGASKSSIKFVTNSPRLRQKLVQKSMNRASNASMGMFMTTSYSGRTMQLESIFANADKEITRIKEMIDATPEGDVETRMELLGELDNYTNIANKSRWQRQADAVAYGLIDGFSERLGTLSIVNKARRVGKSWKNLNRGEKAWRAAGGVAIAGKQLGVEVAEEVAAQIGHNFSDKVILGENKSIFEGVDSNLIADSVVSILALQSGSYMSNVGRTIRDEVQTFQDKKAQAKRGKTLRDLQAKLKQAKDSESRKKIQEEIRTVLQEANIAEFNSYQRFRNLTSEQIDELIEIGGKKSKATSRYLEHMSIMPIGQGKKAMAKWQKERESLEAQLTTLREQQGTILNTAEWKRFQNFTKIANEYNELAKDPKATDEQKISKAFEQQQAAIELTQDKRGKKRQFVEDTASVLPREVRWGGYRNYQAIKDLVTNFGDVATQNNTDYLDDAQAVADFKAETQC